MSQQSQLPDIDAVETCGRLDRPHQRRIERRHLKLVEFHTTSDGEPRARLSSSESGRSAALYQPCSSATSGAGPDAASTSRASCRIPERTGSRSMYSSTR